MGRLWYNLQLETQKENCKRSEKDRDYNFIAKNHQNKCVKAINKNTKEVLYCNCLYTVQQHIGINAGIIKTAREVVKKGPQCVHMWLTKLSCFLVSGVLLSFC